MTSAETTEFKPMLAHAWDGTRDLTGWWLSEKLDGVRALWLPNERRFVSRNWKPINAPEWFIEHMPNFALDGELFVGRGEFQKTVSAVRKKKPVDAEWAQVVYAVFDAPDAPGPCESRWNAVDTFVLADSRAPVITVQQVKCRSPEHLVRWNEYLTGRGAEGLMARAPGSLYRHGRSHDLLKVKSFLDAEARVIGHEPGKGKHEGRLGALLCQTAEGKTFGIGTGLTDYERENPPAIGTTVTYRYFELTKDGVPRFPSFVAVRDYE